MKKKEKIVEEIASEETNLSNEEVIEKATKPKNLKVDLKSVLKVTILLYFVIILVGVLTYVVKPSVYNTVFDGVLEKEVVDPNSWHVIDVPDTRVPWYRWLTVPIESFILNPNRVKMYEIIAMILILGGCFKVIEESGGMQSLIKMIVVKFKKRRFVTIWIITLLSMLLCSFFGLQDELLIMFPVFLSFASAMGWSPLTAIMLVLISSGTGFTVAFSNPYSIGFIADLGFLEHGVFTAVWFRAIIFVVIYVLTSLFLVWTAKRDEAKQSAKDKENAAILDSIVLSPEEKKKAIYVISLFGFVLLMVILFNVIPALEKLGLGLIVMAASFVIGTAVLGGIMFGNAKAWFKSFWKGVKNVAASAIIVIVAYSVFYLAYEASIIHTIAHGLVNLLNTTGKYGGVLILLLFILMIEFFIPSATAKVALLVPILMFAGQQAGLSSNVVALAYLFGDGYTNVIFPTCGTLIIGISVAGVSYTEWIKKTGLFQLVIFIVSALFLLLAVAINL